jgi:hypothetical protein
MFMVTDPIEQSVELLRATRACVEASRREKAQLLDTLASTCVAIRQSRELITRTDETVKGWGSLAPDQINNAGQTVQAGYS